MAVCRRPFILFQLLEEKSGGVHIWRVANYWPTCMYGHWRVHRVISSLWGEASSAHCSFQLFSWTFSLLEVMPLKRSESSHSQVQFDWFFLQKNVGCEGLNFGMTGEKSIASWDSIKVWTASSWGCCCSSRASWAGQTSISNASFIVCVWLKSWILLFLVLVCKIVDYFTSLRFDWFQQHPSFMGVSCRSTVHSVTHHGRWIQSCVSWSVVLVRRFDQTSFCLYVWCIVKPCSGSELQVCSWFSVVTRMWIVTHEFVPCHVATGILYSL